MKPIPITMKLKQFFILTACIAVITTGLKGQTQSPHLPVSSSTPAVALAQQSNSTGSKITVNPSAGVITTSGPDIEFNYNASSIVVGVVLLSIITTPLVSVFLVLFYRERKRQLTYGIIRLMIEKGVPVPPELFLNPRNNLRRGVVLCGGGVGFLILSMITFFTGTRDEFEFWLIGVIPLLMGISYIIVWKLQDGE